MSMIDFSQKKNKRMSAEEDKVYQFFVKTKPSKQKQVYNQALKAAQDEQLDIIKRASALS